MKSIHAKERIRRLLGSRLSDYIARSSISRKLNRLTANQKVHLSSIFGCDFYQNNLDIIDYSEFNGLSAREVALHDAEYKFMLEHISEGDIVIDVGANIGFYSIGMSRLVGRTGRVICFEPGPISFALLSRNIHANAQTLNNNVDLHHCAVSDRDGEVTLFLNPTGESDNQVHHGLMNYEFVGEELTRSKVSVQAVSLDSFLDSTVAARVRFIKIDTQGHEYYVLMGAKQMLAALPEVTLAIEYAPYLKAWEKFTQDDFWNLLGALGFVVYDMLDMSVAVDNAYLKRTYGKSLPGKWTTLILSKGTPIAGTRGST